MKSIVARLLCALGLLGSLCTQSTSAQTAESVGLYNTGTLNGGTNPYSITNPGFGLYEPNSGVYPLDSAWAANTSVAQWLAIYSGGTAPAPSLAVTAVNGGTYNIGLTFDLSSVPSYTGVSFDMNVAVDNNLTVFLNETELTGNTGSPAANGDNNYSDLFNYVYHVTALNTGGANLTAGINFLDFHVTNISGPSGLYVQYSNFAVIPEPSTYAMLLGTGVLGFALLRRRFRA